MSFVSIIIYYHKTKLKTSTFWSITSQFKMKRQNRKKIHLRSLIASEPRCHEKHESTWSWSTFCYSQKLKTELRNLAFIKSYDSLETVHRFSIFSQKMPTSAKSMKRGTLLAYFFKSSHGAVYHGDVMLSI